MTIEEPTVVETPGPRGGEVVRQAVVESRAPSGEVARQAVVETRGPSGGEFARRAVVFVFGLIQALILLRIVFLVLDARQANGLVSGILNVSQVFVGPFDGILHTNALQSGGSVLDLAAIVAIVGWTILEFLVISALGLFRREPA